MCEGEFPSKEVEVDHIQSVVPLDTIDFSWDTYITNLFCSKDNLQVVCKSCHKEKSKQENAIRKEFKTKQMSATYQCWLDMKRRCYNENSQRYYTHGARGITVCEKWKDSFDAFLADMGEKPDGYTIDRIDNNGNYEPSNCKWSTPKEQANNRNTCIFIEHNGEIKTVKQWSEVLGISFSALLKRLRNWPLDKALTASVQEVQEVPEDIKKEILNLWRTTELSQTEVAEMYGISQACISKWNKKETA